MQAPIPLSAILVFTGLWLTSSVQADQTLVPAGATWKYLDNGSNQGTAWQAPFFSDALWAEGAAELGYGDLDEATVVGFGGNTSNRFITTYFRKTFSVSSPSAFSGLNLSLLRDDGAVVYLNGTEVRRDNMPAGPVTSGTLASSALGTPAEATFYSTTISPTLLVAGSNTLAVEIHQANATSSDVSFNLELTGVDTASVTRGPYLQQGTPGSIIVRWRTNIATVGSVSWGLEAGSLANVVEEAAATTEHEIKLTGLQPATPYFYAVGTPSSVFASGPDYTFTTPPPVGTAQPTRIWVLGDSGTADANAIAVRNAYQTFTGPTKTDVWLMLGDNAYNAGTDAEFQAAVFNIYPAFLRQNPLWSAVGNHDTGSSTNPLLTIPYFQIHNFPTNGEAGGIASGTERYYSFDQANIHFICLDSMTSSRSASGPMAIWLQDDLASTVQPWIIAFWHHPPYTKGSHNSDTETQLIEMRQNILPFLEAGGVDLVLAGHSHSYERSYLLNGHYGSSTTLTPAMKKDAGSGREDTTGVYAKPGNNAANQGAVYITAGSSGKISGGTLDHPAMFTSLNNLGSVVLDITGTRLDAKFVRENGFVVDYFTIDKTTPNLPPSVSLSSPADGAVYTAPASINRAATVADPDGQVVQVDFYQGNLSLGSDLTEPFAIHWTGAPAGTYLLTASATDNLGATVTSSPVTVTINDPLPSAPAAPTGITATAGNAQVSLTWTSSAGASSYSVYRASQTGGPWTTPLASGLTATAYNDATAANGTLYFYVVTASNSGGESPVSGEASATPQLPLPTAPQSLTATAGNAQVSLTWTGSAEASSYSVYRASQTGGPWTTPLASGLTATVYTDATAANGTLYFYVVTAINASGEGPASIEASATPTAPPVAPAAPGSLTAKVVGKSRINLSWTDNSANETGFKIERKLGTAAWTQIAVTASNITTYASTGLTANKTYSYRVRAANAAGDSAYSNTVTATTLRK